MSETEADLLASFRCVFVPIGTGPRVVFGEDENGDLVHVLDAKRGGACDLICPDCRGALIANKGTKKQHYFSHAFKIECERAGESALHQYAKKIIEERGSLWLPEVGLQGPMGYEMLRKADEVSFTYVEAEPPMEGFRPDVAATKVPRQGAPRRLLIEILVTHAVDEEKRKLLEKNGETTIEIDLSKVDRTVRYDEDTLAEVILKSAPREWLYHRDIARRKEEIEAERKHKRTLAEAIEKEQTDARAADPAGASAELLAFAEEEQLRWKAIGWERLLFAGGDDDYFDVEPFVWRTILLSWLAPWHAGSAKWARQNDEDLLAESFAQSARAKKLLKKPFLRTGLQRIHPTRGKILWRPAKNQAKKLLWGASTITKREGWEQGPKRIWTVTRSAYAHYVEFVEAVHALSKALSSYRAELLFEGRPMKGADDADPVLLRHPRAVSLISERKKIADALEIIKLDKIVEDTSECREALTGLSLRIRKAGDTAEGAEDRAWSDIDRRIAAMKTAHTEHWKGEVQAHRGALAKSLFSSFVHLAKQAPALSAIMRIEGLDYLFSQNGIAERLGKQTVPQSVEQVAALNREADIRIGWYKMLHRELDLLAAFCSAVADKPLAERIMERGVRRAASQSFDKKPVLSLPGLQNAKDVAGVQRAIAFLDRKAYVFGYGDDLAARALHSRPPEMDGDLLGAVFDGDVVRYRKAFRDILTTDRLPSWVYPGR